MKWKEKKNNNKHMCMCMCIVFFIIECVYWYPMVILSSMFVSESSYVSFPRSFLLVFTLWHLFFKSEMSDLLLGALGHCHFHHCIQCWCDFIPCLIWVEHHFFFVYLLFCYHPHHCFWFISFASPSCSFLIVTYSRFDISLASFLHILLSVWSISLSHYWYFIHIRHPQVHGSRALLYMLHFIHEGMSFSSLGIWA